MQMLAKLSEKLAIEKSAGRWVLFDKRTFSLQELKFNLWMFKIQLRKNRAGKPDNIDFPRRSSQSSSLQENRTLEKKWTGLKFFASVASRLRQVQLKN